MATYRSKLTSQGRVSIPSEVRRKLGLDAGAMIEWEEQDGRMIVRRAGRFTSEDIHRAVFPETPVQAAGIADLDEEICRHVRLRRTRR